MPVSLEVSTVLPVGVPEVWRELIDWAGQSRWIPFTTVRIVSASDAGVGVRAEALSGFWLGRRPIGLLDRFVVTSWCPPGESGTAELGVLHLGPYFTGEGVFALSPVERGTRLHCTELFDLPAGPVTERLARLALPLLRAGFAVSLRRLAGIFPAARR